jgi:hypothetical protein
MCVHTSLHQNTIIFIYYYTLCFPFGALILQSFAFAVKFMFKRVRSYLYFVNVAFQFAAFGLVFASFVLFVKACAAAREEGLGGAVLLMLRFLLGFMCM